MLKSPESPRRNLRLLWWLRSIAVAGQLTAILLAERLGGAALPLAPLFTILSLLAGLNIATWLRLRLPAAVTQREFFLQLLLDIAALAGVLYFTGGAGNPFTSLFILQVVIAAIALDAFYCWLAAGAAIFCYSWLLTSRSTSPLFGHHHADDSFSLHILGMWVNFILLAMLVAWFVTRMAVTLREQDKRLAETEQLAVLGTFAAQAAHDLGTPLASMALLAGEYRQEARTDAERSRVEMLLAQIARCKAQITRIAATAGALRAESGRPVPLEDWLAALLATFHHAHPRASCLLRIAGESPMPVIRAGIGLEEALTNLLVNAAQASAEPVRLEVSYDPQRLLLAVRDRGPGMPGNIGRLLGAPGVTTKESGLGMGLFLSKTVILRLRGTLQAGLVPGGGTEMKISLPLESVSA